MTIKKAYDHEAYLEGIETGEIDFFESPEDLGTVRSSEFNYSPEEMEELVREEEREQLLDRLTTRWLASEKTRRDLAAKVDRLDPKNHESFVETLNELLE